MKQVKMLIASLLVVCPYFVFSQIGAFTLSPSTSAELDLSSISKGILIPRITLSSSTTNPSPVNNPTEGLLIYNSGVNLQNGFYYWTGSFWSLIKTNNGNEIIGPSSSTNNAAVRFNGTSGKSIQNSQVLISDNAEITNVNAISTLGIKLSQNPANGKILLSDNSGNAIWASAPPIDVEENNIPITVNVNTLNFEGGSNVIDNGNNKATIRFYYTSVR